MPHQQIRVPVEETDALLITLTQARKDFKEITQIAADGNTVVITNAGTPWIQIIPIQNQVKIAVEMRQQKLTDDQGEREIVQVTMTEARQKLKDVTRLAADGAIVVITRTKAKNPWLQLMPLGFTVLTRKQEDET